MVRETIPTIIPFVACDLTSDHYNRWYCKPHSTIQSIILDGFAKSNFTGNFLPSGDFVVPKGTPEIPSSLSDDDDDGDDDGSVPVTLLN